MANPKIKNVQYFSHMHKGVDVTIAMVWYMDFNKRRARIKVVDGINEKRDVLDVLAHGVPFEGEMLDCFLRHFK